MYEDDEDEEQLAAIDAEILSSRPF